VGCSLDAVVATPTLSLVTRMFGRGQPIKVDELTNQGHPLFIGKFFDRKTRYERDELGNRVVARAYTITISPLVVK
jgi:hypothetical protein